MQRIEHTQLTAKDTSEKLLIFMHRYCYTQQQVAKKLEVSEQTLSRRIDRNDWLFDEVLELKKLMKKHNVIL